MNNDLPAFRCSNCDNGVELEWEYCAWCGGTKDWAAQEPCPYCSGGNPGDVMEITIEDERRAWKQKAQDALAAVEMFKLENAKLRAAIEDAVETLEAMNLHDTPLYTRLRAIIDRE